MASKKYTEKFKVKALLLLQQNEFNNARTAREVGVTPKTLIGWRDTYGLEVFKTNDLSQDDKMMIPEEREKVIKSLRDDLVKREKDFLDDIYDIRDKAAAKLLDVIEQTTNSRDLTDVLRITQEIITGDQIKSLEERKQNSNFFKFINNQYTQIINHETTDKQED